MRRNVAPNQAAATADAAACSGASTDPIQEATATSYSAVCRNANDASFFRSSSVKPPDPHRGQHTVVAERVDDHRDARMVLGGRAHHRRPADVDLFHALVDAGTGVHGLGERVQVDHHEFERRDAEFLERRDVLGLALIGQQPGVHVGVQRLDAAVEHLGEAGDVLDRRHRNTAPAMVFAVEPVETMATPASCRPRASGTRPVLS